jgi:hypothetical protein
VKHSVGLVVLSLTVLVGVAHAQKETEALRTQPSAGEFKVNGATDCTWTIALTDAEEWIKRGQPEDLYRCDGYGFRKVNVSVKGRLVDGTIWLHDRTPNVEGRHVTVILDLLDGDRVPLGRWR